MTQINSANKCKILHMFCNSKRKLMYNLKLLVHSLRTFTYSTMIYLWLAVSHMFDLKLTPIVVFQSFAFSLGFLFCDHQG